MAEPSKLQAIALPEQLKEPNVSRAVLEEYVLARIRQFSSAFVHTLLGEAGAALPLDLAFNQTVLMLNDNQQQQAEADSYYLRFTHRCKFLGCKSKECSLCINNPHKKCGEHDNFDECYADNQVLKSKCDADVYVELMSKTTGKPAGNLVGAEVLVSVIDGDSVGINNGVVRVDTVRELCRSDEGAALLGAHMTGTKDDGCGRLLLQLQDGSCRLPDLFVKDKNDTFHMDSHTYSSFRLMARVVQRDLMGNPSVFLDHIQPAVSAKFIVKTQRALNDYRKSEYPHFKDELTKLRFIGNITAQRLRDIQAHIPNVPFTSVETPEQLKHLMLYADQNRQVEAKLLEILNMKGKHKHKWDYLREVLLDRIVYDDMVHRAWFMDEALTQGLLFACKQGQINLDKPFGIAQRLTQNGQTRLQVVSPADQASQDLMRVWRVSADEAWSKPGHPGWTLVSEPLELLNLSATSTLTQSMSISMDGNSAQAGPKLKRENTVTGPINFPNFFASAGAGAPASDGSPNPNPFQFTAQRTSTLKNSSNLPTPRSGSDASHMGSLISILAESTSTAGPLNPFAQVARGMAPQAGPKAASDLFRAATAHSLGQSISQVAAAFDAAQRQGSSPHPFAFVAQGRGEHSMEAHRVASTPAAMLQSMPSQLLEALRGASAPGPLPEVDAEQQTSSVSGLAAGGEQVPGGRQTQVLTSRSSRLRRMSAPDPEFVSQILQSAAAGPPQAPVPEGSTDSSMLSKRPRAPLAHDAVLHDPGMASMMLESIARANSNADANAALYHQESMGRHIPRSRMSMEPGQLPEELSLMPPAAEYAHFSADNVLLAGLASVPAADRTASASTAHAGAPPSPSHFLSASMQDSLHIEEGRSPALLRDETSPSQAPGSGGALRAGSPAGTTSSGSGKPKLTLCESDSFNRTINRILQRSESDSFKRMLDVAAFASPTGADQQQHAQEFASFLETFVTEDTG